MKCYCLFYTNYNLKYFSKLKLKIKNVITMTYIAASNTLVLSSQV